MYVEKIGWNVLIVKFNTEFIAEANVTFINKI